MAEWSTFAGNSLCQAAKFFSICLLPDGAVLGVLDEVSVFHEFAGVFIEDCIEDICRE